MESKKFNTLTHKLWVDIVLYVLSIIVLITGILSAITYFNDSGIRLVGPHKPLSILLIIFSVLHVKQHWYWFKNNWGKFNKKNGQLWVMTILFTLTCLSGVAAMFPSPLEAGLETVHTITGILVIKFLTHHLIGYYPTLTKWIKHKRSK